VVLVFSGFLGLAVPEQASKVCPKGSLVSDLEDFCGGPRSFRRDVVLISSVKRKLFRLSFALDL
jgi:hypothetical protein